MPSATPPQVLSGEVLLETEHDGRRLVVAGPPGALAEEPSGVGDLVVGDGGHVSTFFRGFVETTLEEPAATWDLTFDYEVRGPRAGWASFATEQSFLGGPDEPDAVLLDLKVLAHQIETLESI